jgi:hypothetical protein
MKTLLSKSLSILVPVIVIGLFVALLSKPHWMSTRSWNDEAVDDDVARRSTDLEGDLKSMWRTVPFDEGGEVSPVSAINAASRVFSTVDLVGCNKKEIEQRLHARARPNYKYSRAFFPEDDAVVYRFDCGKFGWQFSVLFDQSGTAVAIKRQWIH